MIAQVAAGAGLEPAGAVPADGEARHPARLIAAARRIHAARTSPPPVTPVTPLAGLARRADRVRRRCGRDRARADRERVARRSVARRGDRDRHRGAADDLGGPRRARADDRDVPRARRHGAQLPRRRLRVLARVGRQRRARRPRGGSQRARRHVARAARVLGPARAVARHDGAAHADRDAAVRPGRPYRLRQPRGARAARRRPPARGASRCRPCSKPRPSRCATRSRAAATGCSSSRTSTVATRTCTTSHAAAFDSTAARTSCSCCASSRVELHRQEVAAWKKVIRVISHELNNSLAPIASLAHSGASCSSAASTEQLERVFATIAERARHLEQFIQGYAKFAKLPTPRLEPIAWPELLERLRSADRVSRRRRPARCGRAQIDPAQLEQALRQPAARTHTSRAPRPTDIQLGVPPPARAPSRSRSAIAARA